MRTSCALAIAAALFAGSAAQDRKVRNSYLGKAPPELAADADTWLNAKEPLSLSKLKGKVVWLEFSYTH